MLEFLTAILAFAAIMILLSTLVTVMVETVQKFLRMRRAGFQQMLEGLYESVLRDVLNRDLEQAPSNEIAKAKKGANLRQATKSVVQKFGTTSDSSIKASIMTAANEAADMSDKDGVEHVAKKIAGAKFAEEIMRNPNFYWVADRSWLGRGMLWLRRRIVTTDFQSLDTREFVEQLANTQAGDKLAGLAKPKLEGALRTLAYQFERYGDAASDYFARRAWVLSVFIALVFAFVVNVDAVRTFRTLVLKPVVAQKLVEAMNVLDEGEKRSEPRGEGFAAGATETDESGSDRDAEAKLKALRESMDQVNEKLAELSAQGLPIGRAYFPFCSAYLEALERGGRQPDSTKAGTGAAIDMEVCEKAPEMKHRFARAWKGKWLLAYLGGAADRLVYEGRWVKWIFTRETGWGWFLSTLLAGGLIGLGAPFWYDLYRKAALVLPVAQVASQFVSSGRKTVVAAPPQDEVAEKPGGGSQSELPRSIRRSDKATIAPADLHDAFMRARSGRPSSPKRPRGPAPKR